ncbi:MAG: ferredoxin-type protein NapG [Arenicellales bacterium]
MKFSGNRRKFLTETARTAAGVGVAALMLGIYARQSRALPADAIRPPGALEEDEFLGACIRCGLCVRDCPYDTLSLAAVGDDVALGTPYFTARNIPCEMCPDIPCIKACPTGALDHALEDIDDARMGLAVVIDQEACIAFQGLRCEVCFNICPIRGKAIDLDMRHNERSGKHALFIPIVHSDACTGCGKCEQACILEQAAIKVMPMSLAKGQMQGHYRLGWDEKEKAGGSLIGTEDKHDYNLPEGTRYDYEGEGLIPGDDTSKVPFSDNPLDALNGRKEGM